MEHSIVKKWWYLVIILVIVFAGIKLTEKPKNTIELVKINVPLKKGIGQTVNFNQSVPANQSIFYWLVGHDIDANINYADYYHGTNLKLCVQNVFRGGLKVDYFYRQGNNFLAKRFGYNVITDTVSGFDSLSSLSQGDCAMNYWEVDLSKVVLDASTTPLLLVVKPVAKGSKIYLMGDGSRFPVQGEIISSNGKSGQNGEVSRQVGVLRVYDASPFLVDSVMGWGNVLSN
jgi:hypothetical protein